MIPEASVEAGVRSRPTWIGVAELYRLNAASRTVRVAVDGVGLMLVGSSLVRKDYRDVDLRMILFDEDFAARFPNQGWLMLANAAMSDWMATTTGLPVDFQFQSMAEANGPEHEGKRRHPLGLPMRFDTEAVAE